MTRQLKRGIVKYDSMEQEITIDLEEMENKLSDSEYQIFMILLGKLESN